VGDTTNYDSEPGDLPSGDGGGSDDATAVDLPAAGDGTTGGDAKTATARLRRRPVLLGLGTASAVVVILVGAVVAGSSGTDDGPRSAEDVAGSAATTTTRDATTSTTTTTTSTTTTTAPPPTTTTTAAPRPEPTDETPDAPADDGVMTPGPAPAPRATVCGLGPWGESSPKSSLPGPPDQAQLVDGPVWNCANGPAGCTVSISTAWSDGVTASNSSALPGPGAYTVNDGRGTAATFSVSPDLLCSFNGADYSNFWPGGT
jgi:hypothetical protein